MDLRSSFTAHLPDKNARILEIGPLNRPLVDKRQYPNAVYCDIRSTDQIKALYTSNDYLSTTNIVVPIDEIVDVDFVLNGGYAETFRNFSKFDYVVASHVLEHVEDLIGVLNDVMSILTPLGKFIIFYPDQRYCFDHFRAEASFRDAYDVHIHQRPALARMVLDFFHSALPENDAFIFWQAEGVQDLLPNNSTQQAIQRYNQSSSGQFMDDVHYWPFSDAGFIRFLYDCVRSDLLKVFCTEFYPTQENTQEFLVILQNGMENWNRDNALQRLRLQYKKVAGNYYNSRQLACGKLQMSIDELQGQIAGKDIHIVELQNDIAEMSNQLEALQSHIAGQDDQVKALQSYIAEQDSHTVVLQQRITSQTDELKHYAEELAACVAHITQLETIENSTIWRMTAPLRRLLDAVKGK